MNDLKLYDCSIIEKEIHDLAVENDGELTDEQWEILAAIQTQSKEKLENVARYIKYLEYFVSNCKEEKKRIDSKQKSAENKISNLKKFINPYLREHGPINTGTFTLSDRISHQVEIPDENKVPKLYKTTVKTIKIDKNSIKSALNSAKRTIKWAFLKENHNTQIK